MYIAAGQLVEPIKNIMYDVKLVQKNNGRKDFGILNREAGDSESDNHSISK